MGEAPIGRISGQFSIVPNTTRFLGFSAMITETLCTIKLQWSGLGWIELGGLSMDLQNLN